MMWQMTYQCLSTSVVADDTSPKTRNWMLLGGLANRDHILLSMCKRGVTLVSLYVGDGVISNKKLDI